MSARLAAWLALAAIVTAACSGKAVLVDTRVQGATQAQRAAENGPVEDAPSVLSEGGSEAVSIGEIGGVKKTAAPGVDAKCATNSDPSAGFTADTVTWGNLSPLTGSLRPLGEQSVRAMRASIDWVNNITKFEGPYPLDWGCSERPGIFGRKIELKVFSLGANTPEEALAGMRRLIDVEKSFLVRDCYLASGVLGPASEYQNAKGVPAVWCYYSEMPYPALAPWTFAPGTSPLMSHAIHTGYLVKKLGRQRLAILADPSTAANGVTVIRRVAEYLGHPIPDSCVVYKSAYETANGMRPEITALRQCYGAGTSPDAVMALDALNATFGSMEAKSQQWRAADNNVQWDCSGTSCWVTSLADLCGDACEGLITDCTTLPCVPWASPEKFPAVVGWEQVRAKYLPNDPPDILTYAPISITAGIALWMAMTGPDLSAAKFGKTLESLSSWDAGIGPIISTSKVDHFGAKGVWLIKFTGRAPWFDDITGGFLTTDEVGVPGRLAEKGA